MRLRLLAGFSGAVVALALVGAAANSAVADDMAREVPDNAVVRTADGSVRGTVESGQRTFLGIPYAAPPVGERRWRAPQPVTPWSGVRDATQAGAECPQQWDTEEGPVISGKEDCLFINVDTPLDITEPLPVMVFVHGGGVVTGQGAPYDPARIVDAGDVIVVTMNYRLGALGFLDHPDLDDPYAGNFGLADQQAALRWVRRNIAAFGGDPGNVTLWGESGGGFSICAQLAAPGARGLFHKAIVQSAPCGNAVSTRPAAQRRGVRAAELLGCPNRAGAMECLRAKPFADFVPLYAQEQDLLLRDIGTRPWWPVAGTPAVPLQPLTALRLGLAADVPLIHGGTRDEMRSTVLVAGRHLVTASEYAAEVGDLFGARDARAILARYPAADFPTPGLALATVLTDRGGMVGTCSQLPANDAAARGAPVYAYEFAEPSPQVIDGFPLGAHHGVDIPYFFDGRWPTPAAQAQTRASAEMSALRDKLIDYWTTFARSGQPGPDWRPYRRGTALSIAADQIAPVDVAREHRCAFWRTLDLSPGGR